MPYLTLTQTVISALVFTNGIYLLILYFIQTNFWGYLIFVQVNDVNKLISQSLWHTSASDIFSARIGAHTVWNLLTEMNTTCVTVSISHTSYK